MIAWVHPRLLFIRSLGHINKMLSGILFPDGCSPPVPYMCWPSPGNFQRAPDHCIQFFFPLFIAQSPVMVYAASYGKHGQGPLTGAGGCAVKGQGDVYKRQFQDWPG